jgi:hypothetical protein
LSISSDGGEETNTAIADLFSTTSQELNARVACDRKKEEIIEDGTSSFRVGIALLTVDSDPFIKYDFKASAVVPGCKPK